MEENTHQQGSKHGYLKSEGIRHEHTANYLRNRCPSPEYIESIPTSY